jgi:hypothetical protein
LPVICSPPSFEFGAVALEARGLELDVEVADFELGVFAVAAVVPQSSRTPMSLGSCGMRLSGELVALGGGFH